MFVKNVLPPTGKRRKERKGTRGKQFSFGKKKKKSSPPASALALLSFSSSHHLQKPITAALMADVYDEHKDVDGFLYMTFSGENTFGGGEEGEEEESELLSLLQ